MRPVKPPPRPKVQCNPYGNYALVDIRRSRAWPHMIPYTLVNAATCAARIVVQVQPRTVPEVLRRSKTSSTFCQLTCAHGSQLAIHPQEGAVRYSAAFPHQILMTLAVHTVTRKWFPVKNPFKRGVPVRIHGKP